MTMVMIWALTSCPPGYTRSELSQAVVFVKSSKDPTTGDFCRDRKELLWCLQDRCEEAAPGVWTGSWYFTYLLGEKEGRRAWVDSMNRRVVKELGGKAIQIDPDIYRGMLREKDKGNRAFSRGQYKSALDCYLQAEKMMGGEVSGIYLVPNQRAEMVKVLSNQAECYLRMKKYEEAFIQATTALQLDKRHQKSMSRSRKKLPLLPTARPGRSCSRSWKRSPSAATAASLDRGGVGKSTPMLKRYAMHGTTRSERVAGRRLVGIGSQLLR